MDKSKLIIDLCEKMTAKEREKLLSIISEISERSYRRGVQQTLHLTTRDEIDEWIEKDEAESFRYEKSDNISIGLDGFTRDSVSCLLANEPWIHFLQT